MIQDRLWLEVERVADRYHQLRFWRALAVGWVIAAAVVLLLSASGVVTSRNPSVIFPVIGSVATVLVVLCALAVHATKLGPEWVARQIEAEFPDLGSCLLTAIEQQPALTDGRFGFLQESVIRQALVHAACHPWTQVVPARRLAWAVVTQSVTLALFVLALTNAPVGVTRSLIASSPEDAALVASTSDFSVEVEPGTTAIEKGTSLLVLARIIGQVPAEATLVMQPVAGESTQLEMTRSLEDPVFGGRIATVKESLDYRVELGGRATPTYRVTVFEYPRLERADARLVYPSYTGLKERVVQDVRTISVVEGTQVTLICKLNKSVKLARFIERSPAAPRQESRTPTDDANSKDVDGASGIRLAERDGYYEATITATKSHRLKLELIDEADRRNVEQADISINVVPNQPPTLKLVQPAKDLEVSPLEELDVKATAWDDFGVKRMGLSFALAGSSPIDVILGENAAAKQKHELANAIKFEELEAQPDQLLSYFFWAEDFGPDGNLRRTSSDMYFAEVRHFEEIFRQGQQPPGGEQQRQQQQQQQQNSPAGQQAQQLAQNQKDIINATWKLIRRETGPKATMPFAEDVEQLVQAQNALLEKSKALAEKVGDEQSQAHVEALIGSMLEAVKQLMTAHEQTSAATLQPALAAEQAAYQALLKLRAREHEVVRQQQQQQQQQASSSQSQSQPRSGQQQQQMEQLNLKKEENRYESQRQAQAQQEKPEDRETRQVLNRLRELARRQNDLNERLKDLQSALQEAQTAEQKEEIKQQLKRLQDEQKQVLRDSDELQARMESPENQERMSEERQRLEQAREQVQRASEALEKEQVSQAAASGTRAEKEFEELRNEFRRQASNRFNDEMREMRESARELDQEQQKISEKLTEITKPDPSTKKSLRDDSRSDEVVKGLNEQKEKLSNLTERMKQTIEEAEQTEPLLTERLYDASRNVQNQKVDRALEAVSRSLQRGLIEDAQKVEQIADRGIKQLREEVEKAAEAVLGDETEALRRAREQLKNLSQELNREVARNSPEEGSQLPRERSEHEGENGRQGERETKDEPNQASQQQPGDRRPNENQNGERQQGQRQNGQQPNAQRPDEQQSPAGQQPGQARVGQQPNERQPNEDQPRQRPANGQQPGEQQSGQPTGNQPQRRQQPEQQPGNQPGERQPGQSQPSQQSGQPGQQLQGGQPQPGQPQSGRRGAPQLADSKQPGGARSVEGDANREFAPISGEDFLNWSDRLRDVEEMVDDPELRAEAARIRDEARAIRAEMKRHSKEPNWNLVRVNVAQPLVELSNRVSDELLRRTSKQAIVPLDRDPVPPKYSEKTRRYYERLGSGK